MAVATQTEFPSSFTAGDTIRTTFSDSRFPSTLWTAKVLLQSSTESKSFAATAGTGTAFNLLITAAKSAKIASGLYVVTYIYTEIATQERMTAECTTATTVFSNPESGSSKGIARQTLEAMQAAFLKVAKNPRLSVNFVGQSFTNRNLKDFQDAIDRQQAVVNAEDAARIGHRRIARILHPL